MHEGTLAFTATTPGTYRYLCPVPGHAQKGMTGTFTIRLPIAYHMSLDRARSRDMITPARTCAGADATVGKRHGGYHRHTGASGPAVPERHDVLRSGRR
jgi:hypothetical protein